MRRVLGYWAGDVLKGCWNELLGMLKRGDDGPSDETLCGQSVQERSRIELDAFCTIFPL